MGAPGAVEEEKQTMMIDRIEGNAELKKSVRMMLAFSVQGRSAGPEAGRGVPTPPSLPLDSTHPATGQGLHALDNPKEEVEAQKS